MKINKVVLEKVSFYQDQYPEGNLPEIALAGRSNVGKSSFVNSIAGTSKLARTSKVPGKTRTINFYNVNGDFRLVDLPGYGYAKVSKKEKEKWGEIINEYLNVRENLEEVILVVDIRHKPTTQDVQMYQWIRSFGYKGYVLATKGDKISKGKFQAHTKIIRQELGVEDNSLIIPYSSESKVNKEGVLKVLASILRT